MSKSKSSPDEPKPPISPRRRLVLIAAALLGIGFTVRFAREWQTVSSTPIISWERETNADCAIVLTGGPGRVREGFDLLSDHRVKKLIVSGVHPDARLREVFPLWPFYGNLHEEDVILERRSETTWGNAQQSLLVAEALRCRDLLLITSRVHMSRAIRTFRAVFPEGVRIEAQPVVGNRFESPFWELTLETTKSLFYSLWAY